MITYDGLVRSANNQILQYFYGGSNLDQVKQKEVKINLINMNNEKIRSMHVFTKTELNTLFKKSKENLSKLNEDYYNKLIEFRDELRKIVIKSKLNYVTFQDKFMLPANLFRIINSNKNTNEKSDLEFTDVIETLDEIMSSENTKLFCMTSNDRKKESLKREIEGVNKYLFMISIYEYLSPRRCIIDYKFTKKILEKVKNDIISAFNKAVVDPGEMVGILGAQSMGERTTQLNLNTKHSAGAIKKGTQGVTRMNEILRCTKNIKTPILTIYLKDEYKHDKESAYKIASYIGYLTLRNIVLKSDIGYDPNIETGYIKKDNIDPKSALQIYDTKLELNKHPWMFRFTINREMLYAKKLKLTEIKINFVKFWRDKLNNIKNISKYEKDIFNRIISCTILSSNENDINSVIHLRFDMNNYDINKIIELQDYVLSYFNLKGLSGVNSIEVIPQSQIDINENGDIENTDQYILQTDGINMSGIRGIIGIDHVKTITNDMYSIYSNFGIEAVRNAIINEISDLITNVNYHHIALLIDVMTHGGGLISIDRHGINRQDTDPLSRASFEKTMEQFLNAAAFNETDKLKSVSSRIIIGRMINGGTGYCNLLMDNDILENTELNVSSIEQGLNETDVILKLEENAIINDLIDRDSNIFIV
jgi:DNA-directed RNA polymerase II subunit RPB1